MCQFMLPLGCSRFVLVKIRHQIIRQLNIMPKNVDLTDVRLARAAKQAKKHSYGPSYLVKLQVLGTGAKGAPQALYVFTPTSSFLFNCSEGTQRLCSEHRTRLIRLEDVLITSNSWRNIGGTLGTLLTLSGMGLHSMTLHGPPGLRTLYSATRSFIQLRGMEVHHKTDVHKGFVSGGIEVETVPLYGDRSKRGINDGSPETEENSEHDQMTDYFSFDRTGRHSPPSQNTRRRNGDQDREEAEVLDERATAFAYVCTLPRLPGRLQLEKCVELGIKPGPMLGLLKSGQNVTLDDGRVVKSADVTTPTKQPSQFVVVELPSADFLPSLATLSSRIATSRLLVVVHFTPQHVMRTDAYRGWMAALPAGVRHIALNEAGSGFGSEAMHKVHHQLGHIDADLFPPLRGEPIETVVSKAGRPTPSLQSSKMTAAALASLISGADLDNQYTVGRDMDGLTMTSDGVCFPKPGWSLNLLPEIIPDTSGVPKVTPSDYLKALEDCEGFSEQVARYRSYVAKQSGHGGDIYPQTVFLGTGSSVPNKKRNTSAILLNLSEDSSMLLDCGEGTFGQMVRLYGADHTDHILRRLGVIYISHMHADHHIGLINILEKRRLAMGDDCIPCLLFAPKTIRHYLSTYHKYVAPLLDSFTLVDNDDLCQTGLSISVPAKWPVLSAVRRRLSELDIVSLETCPVVHCHLSYGVRVTVAVTPPASASKTQKQEGDSPSAGANKTQKQDGNSPSAGANKTQKQDGDSRRRTVVYSGDTRPCPRLVTMGMDCDLLIHESTHQDDLMTEAVLHCHSTCSEAMDVGRRMRARHMILTHFSQRYSSLIVLPESVPDNVGVAYDNMVVDFGHLHRLPAMLPVLKAAYSDDLEELQEKAAKRLRRLEKNQQFDMHANRC